ncbi:MAG: GNAT family N-acetyltransferase [Pseudomonadota bacterium]
MTSATSVKLSVQRLTSPEALRSLADECTRLAAQMRPRLPFATPDWLTLWWRHYRENRLFVRDEFYVHAVRNEHGALVALAPLLVTERPAHGPLRCRNIAFFGADKNVTELRGLVCAPEDEAAATAALLTRLFEHSHEWDWLVWDGVRKGSEAHAALSKHPNFEWRRENTDYVLPLPGSWDDFRASRSRNIKESLRKCYNSLKRAGHHFQFRVVERPSELPAALNQFFALHQRRASASQLVRHQDVFATPHSRKFLLDLAARSGATTELRVFQLQIAGNVVASRVGFLMGDELYLYFSGYEPDWGDFSVMTTTVAESIKWAIEHQVRLVNLSPGTDVSKTRWGATPITTCDGVLLSNTKRGKVAFDLLSEVHRRSRQGTFLARLLSVAKRHG